MIFQMNIQKIVYGIYMTFHMNIYDINV